jgi:L-ascorbate metabolism protein UlaG (beta-lactamase superfamily)
MNNDQLTLTLIGGPTLLIEFAGIRFLTDPTLDPRETDYKTNVYTLHKTADPGLAADQLGKIDYVLLSHDHHFDNLDHAGRAMLKDVTAVYTTTAGAGRLAGNAVGLTPWQKVEVKAGGNRIIEITATPARHGPADGDRGPVIGFVLTLKDEAKASLYISGDTVWFEGVAEVAQRFPAKALVLFMGAATVKEVGPNHLTMTAREALQAAEAFPGVPIIPIHCDGWAHFMESRKDILDTFERAGQAERLVLLEPGHRTRLHT